MSLEQLAERSNINKQTIWRLEHREHTKSREHTIRQLATALKTDPDVLTGKKPLPDTSDDDSGYFLMGKLNFRVSYSAYNAFYLVSERYYVTYQEVVELAPFLFCCLAEASLRRRRARLEQTQRAYEVAHNVEAQMQHLGEVETDALKEKFEAEAKSIDVQDLFGLHLDHVAADPSYDGTRNPFALFLDDLANDTGGTATFNNYAGRDFPEYRVCPDEAARIAGDDSKLADHILEGHILLNDMPKEVREKWDERTEWVRAKVKEYQEEMQRMIGHIVREASP